MSGHGEPARTAASDPPPKWPVLTPSIEALAERLAEAVAEHVVPLPAAGVRGPPCGRSCLAGSWRVAQRARVARLGRSEREVGMQEVLRSWRLSHLVVATERSEYEVEGAEPALSPGMALFGLGVDRTTLYETIDSKSRVIPSALSALGGCVFGATSAGRDRRVRTDRRAGGRPG